MSEHFRFKYIIEIKKEKDVKKMNWTEAITKHWQDSEQNNLDPKYSEYSNT
jgi:hypothetical protein